MDAQTIVEDYVNDVAARLPRRLRNDVGLELRTLLTEHVQATAVASDRPLDSSVAFEVLRRFGTPAEIAARYRPRGFAIIEPEHAPAFVKLAGIFVITQWALTLPSVFQSQKSVADWWLGPGLGALWWVGLLTVWFAVLGWGRRRFSRHVPVDGEPCGGEDLLLATAERWKSVDRESAARQSALFLLPLSVALIVFFVSPGWSIALLLPGSDTAWAVYAADFRRELLPVLIGLMSLRLLLVAVVLARASWWRRSEIMRFALRVVFIALLYWSIFDWVIFANASTDILFKGWLLIFAAVNTVQIILWIRRASVRVRPQPVPYVPGNDFERRP